MPKKYTVEEENIVIDNPVIEKPKRTRKMTPEALEKLKHARELALRSRREGKAINEELNQAKKETFSEKIDQVETYKKIKGQIDNEVKSKIDNLYNRFEGYLEEKNQRRQMKDQRKEQKKAHQIVKELPNAISQHILENEVKKLELERWRKRMFGV
jgi:hypothetical protein